MNTLAPAPSRDIAGIMWKTVSEDCNLACDYCYYSTCGGRPGARRRIPLGLLETGIRKCMERSPGAAGFTWQGGEPLLAGLEFFETVVALQAKHAPAGTAIGNAVQTNGTLLSDDWARFFDNVLSVYCGHEAEACQHRRSCSRTLIVEQNGDAYPCDFYIAPEWRLGNIERDALEGILDHPAYRRFMQFKEELPQQCRRCRHLALCHGGCPRSRVADETRGGAGPDYFCAAYRRFFDHAHDRMTRLARKLRARWLAEHARAGRPWPARNEPRVCGSGRKFKRCCGPLRDELRVCG